VVSAASVVRFHGVGLHNSMVISKLARSNLFGMEMIASYIQRMWWTLVNSLIAEVKFLCFLRMCPTFQELTFISVLLDVHKGIFAIFEHNLTSGTTKTLVDASPGGASRPELSRDRRTLAFVRRVRDKEALVL